MDNKDAKYFIETYRDLYFNPDQPEKRKALGIEKLNGTEKEAEEYVMNLMHSGVFEKTAFAWKAGKVCWDESKNELTYRPEFEGEDNGTKCYRNGYGKPVCITGFEQYCYGLMNNKDEIMLSIDDEDWEEAYKKALTNAPVNFGPVNIINALFFLSCGEAPIYDAFAHKAARALAMDLIPSEVFMGSNPSKTETNAINAMYNEYISLLKSLFPNQIHVDGNQEFIPRDLDRALWVYGHSSKKWSYND